LTDFATWWKRADGGIGLGALASFLLLSGCGSAPPTVKAPAPPAPSRPAAQAAAAPAVPPGLTPLPTSQQVVAAFAVGRKDPFAPLGVAATGSTGAATRPASAPPPAFLQDFRVTGVIHSGARSEAVVTYKSLSGSLREGDRGGGNTDLLPSGWSVASVDVQKGRLILQNGGRKVTVDL
jgi:Tfp pilus assembly protein PilP